MLTIQVLMYVEGHGQTRGTIWNDATVTLTHFKGPGTVLNWISLSVSTAGKCTPIQPVKQPEHRRASTFEEQKCSSFQTN